jgi:hypothetical protein
MTGDLVAALKPVVGILKAAERVAGSYVHEDNSHSLEAGNLPLF